jgi:N12 class adenine-specific DNA methylase
VLNGTLNTTLDHRGGVKALERMKYDWMVGDYERATQLYSLINDLFGNIDSQKHATPNLVGSTPHNKARVVIMGLQ